MKTLTLHTTCYQPMLERVWAGISVFNLDIKSKELGTTFMG
jgi:hypothetical protein